MITAGFSVISSPRSVSSITEGTAIGRSPFAVLSADDAEASITLEGSVPVLLVAGCFARIGDKLACIKRFTSGVGDFTLYLDGLIGAAEGSSVWLQTPPVHHGDVFSVESNDGNTAIVIKQRESVYKLGSKRLEVSWPVTGPDGYSAVYSMPFYLPPKVQAPVVEIGFSLAGTLALERCHASWKPLREGDSPELAVGATAGWAQWPANAALSVASSAVTPGTYSLTLLSDGDSLLYDVSIPPGWYRLVSSIAVEAAEVVHVVYAED